MPAPRAAGSKSPVMHKLDELASELDLIGFDNYDGPLPRPTGGTGRKGAASTSGKRKGPAGRGKAVNAAQYIAVTPADQNSSGWVDPDTINRALFPLGRSATTLLHGSSEVLTQLASSSGEPPKSRRITIDDSTAGYVGHHSAAYHSAVSKLESFCETDLSAEGIQRKRQAVRGELESGYFPMTLDEDRVSDLTGMPCRGELQDPNLRSDMFRSNIHRINDTIEADLYDATALQDLDCPAGAHPGPSALPPSSPFYLRKDSNTIMQSRIAGAAAATTASPHLPPLGEPSQPERPRQASPARVGSAEVGEGDGVAEGDLAAGSAGETSQPSSSRSAPLSPGGESLAVEGGGGGGGEERPLSAEQISLLYKQELASLFNAAQRVVKIQVDEESSAPSEVLAGKPLAHLERALPGAAGASPTSPGVGRPPQQQGGAAAGPQKRKPAAKGHPATSRGVVEYLVDPVPSESSAKRGGGAYTSPMWVIKVKVLETILQGQLDLNHIACLVKAVRACHQELQVTRLILYRKEELLLRERRRNEALQMREDIAVCRSRLRRGQLVQIAAQIYKGVVEGGGHFRIPTGDAEDPQAWHELNQILDNIANGDELAHSEARRGVAHEQMLQALTYKTQLAKRERHLQRRFEQLERSAMEGEDALSVAGQTFTVGNDLEVNALAVLRALSTLEAARSSQLDHATSGLLNHFRPDQATLRNALERAVQTDATIYTPENFARLEDEVRTSSETVSQRDATIKKIRTDARAAQDELGQLVTSQKLMQGRLDEQIRLTQKAEADRAMYSALVKQRDEELLEKDRAVACLEATVRTHAEAIASAKAEAARHAQRCDEVQLELEATVKDRADLQLEATQLKVEAAEAEGSRQIEVEGMLQREKEAAQERHSELEDAMAAVVERLREAEAREEERLNRTQRSTSVTPPQVHSVGCSPDPEEVVQVSLGDVLQVAAPGLDEEVLLAERRSMYADSMRWLVELEEKSRSAFDDVIAETMSAFIFMNSFIVLVINTSYPSCFKEGYSLNGNGKFNKMKTDTIKMNVIAKLKSATAKLPPIVKAGLQAKAAHATTSAKHNPKSPDTDMITSSTASGACPPEGLPPIDMGAGKRLPALSPTHEAITEEEVSRQSPAPSPRVRSGSDLHLHKVLPVEDTSARQPRQAQPPPAAAAQGGCAAGTWEPVPDDGTVTHDMPLSPGSIVSPSSSAAGAGRDSGSGSGSGASRRGHSGPPQALAALSEDPFADDAYRKPCSVGGSQKAEAEERCPGATPLPQLPAGGAVPTERAPVGVGEAMGDPCAPPPRPAGGAAQPQTPLEEGGVADAVSRGSGSRKEGEEVGVAAPASVSSSAGVAAVGCGGGTEGRGPSSSSSSAAVSAPAGGADLPQPRGVDRVAAQQPRRVSDPGAVLPEICGGRGSGVLPPLPPVVGTESSAGCRSAAAAAAPAGGGASVVHTQEVRLQAATEEAAPAAAAVARVAVTERAAPVGSVDPPHHVGAEEGAAGAAKESPVEAMVTAEKEKVADWLEELDKAMRRQRRIDVGRVQPSPALEAADRRMVECLARVERLDHKVPAAQLDELRAVRALLTNTTRALHRAATGVAPQHVIPTTTTTTSYPPDSMDDCSPRQSAREPIPARVAVPWGGRSPPQPHPNAQLITALKQAGAAAAAEDLSVAMGGGAHTADTGFLGSPLVQGGAPFRPQGSHPPQAHRDAGYPSPGRGGVGGALPAPSLSKAGLLPQRRALAGPVGPGAVLPGRAARGLGQRHAAGGRGLGIGVGAVSGGGGGVRGQVHGRGRGGGGGRGRGGAAAASGPNPNANPNTLRFQKVAPPKVDIHIG